MEMFRFVPKMYPSEFYHLSIYPSNCILTVMDENPADLIAPLHYNSRKVYTITLPTKLVKGMKLQEGDYLHLQITPVLRPSTPAK